MAGNVQNILKLGAPIIVEIGRLSMAVNEVLALAPGSILEIDKRPEEELELLVNNKVVATGAAVKIGERFGIKITFVGDVRARIEAMGASSPAKTDTASDENAEALADQLLQGQ